MTSALVTEAALEHGGQLAQARLLFPGAPEPFLDLSTGINSVPYPLPALAPRLWTALPDRPAEDALRAAACAAYGVGNPAMVVPAPGTQVLISLLPFVLPQERVAVLSPTYGEHAASWRAAGAAVREVAGLGELEQASCAVLCNPNNPDGRNFERAELLALADRLAARGGLLIVDEAFVDFTPELSLAPAVPHPALLLLRSFGKAYGMAGVRLGFALAGPRLAARVRAALGPWAVSGVAAEIGRQALADAAWRARTGARLAGEAARLDGLMAAAGLRVVGGTTLFRLGEGAGAPGVFRRLGEAGVFVRRFTARPDWLRFGLPGTEDGWRRLETALRR